jgi:hypothetical protein
MKSLPIAIFTSTVLLLNIANAQDKAFAKNSASEKATFLQPGQWWNLYSDERNDAIKRTVRAVKIVRLSNVHPSWVQIAFPKDRKEHGSIFGPAAKAHENKDVNVDVEIAEWEKSITQWKTIWINLDFVYSMSPVQLDEARERPVAAGVNG